MKELLRQYASHTVWANQKLTDVVLSLSEELQTKHVTSSFNSLHLTIVHMWSADSIWWQRMKMQEHINVPMETFKGNTKDAVFNLLQQGKQWEEWVNGASDLALDHTFQYYNNKRELFKQPMWQTLMHLFNHATYHRGQLVTILRQLGVEKIPQTDYIVWTRKK